MTEWVQIRHPDLPKAEPATVSKQSLETWKREGWKLVKPAKGDEK